MVFVGRKEHVLREVNLHAMPFVDGDGRRYLDEAVEDCGWCA
jgi:hypothetical protein